MDQQASRYPPIARPRHDGWTRDKQIAFIIALRSTRNVSRAAAAVGMSRESAYRLRARPSAAEFAAAWDHALRATAASAGHIKGHESHSSAPLPMGLSAREHHESHSLGRNAPQRQLNQLPSAGACGARSERGRAQEHAGHALSTEVRLSPARRAELLALIDRAGRG